MRINNEQQNVLFTFLVHEGLEIHFYLFSQEHETGSHFYYTLNIGYNSDKKEIQYAKGSNSSNFLFARALLLELAVLARRCFTLVTCTHYYLSLIFLSIFYSLYKQYCTTCIDLNTLMIKFRCWEKLYFTYNWRKKHHVRLWNAHGLQ